MDWNNKSYVSDKKSSNDSITTENSTSTTATSVPDKNLPPVNNLPFNSPGQSPVNNVMPIPSHLGHHLPQQIVPPPSDTNQVMYQMNGNLYQSYPVYQVYPEYSDHQPSPQTYQRISDMEDKDGKKRKKSTSSASSTSSKSPVSSSAKMPAKRSRMGCITCRQRKKRCCETKPKCTECTRLKLNCVWPAPGTEHKNKSKELKEEENVMYHEIYGKIKVLRGIVEYKSDEAPTNNEFDK
ncbi:hypothetical protein CLIB1444_11S03950 [[Candida] jaroonii]|uniref:Uncharacterized protein n=1 Tax=[Candida] jaroonii TaxID=467808 RepID=A0ACA9YCV8_9ASCO|nr:hypothetical protein CLIB1444_11S03950 [[Candida] jaroonii]